jgi:hypothetical protein
MICNFILGCRHQPQRGMTYPAQGKHAGGVRHPGFEVPPNSLKALKGRDIVVFNAGCAFHRSLHQFRGVAKSLVFIRVHSWFP